jgi:putative effector of murein hydrolase LrgA (UPF0299 family)
MSKVLKGILLYSTILYFFFFIAAAESLFQLSLCHLVIGLFILIALVGGCSEAFRNENLEDFVPKFLR